MLTTIAPPKNPLTQYDRQKKRTAERNEALYQRFFQLYEEQRVRYDDVLSQVAAHFFLSPATVEKILRNFR